MQEWWGILGKSQKLLYLIIIITRMVVKFVVYIVKITIKYSNLYDFSNIFFFKAVQASSEAYLAILYFQINIQKHT